MFKQGKRRHSTEELHVITRALLTTQAILNNFQKGLETEVEEYKKSVQGEKRVNPFLGGISMTQDNKNNILAEKYDEKYFEENIIGVYISALSQQLTPQYSSGQDRKKIRKSIGKKVTNEGKFMTKTATDLLNRYLESYKTLVK